MQLLLLLQLVIVVVMAVLLDAGAKDAGTQDIMRYRLLRFAGSCIDGTRQWTASERLVAELPQTLEALDSMVPLYRRHSIIFNVRNMRRIAGLNFSFSACLVRVSRALASRRHGSSHLSGSSPVLFVCCRTLSSLQFNIALISGN